MRQFLNLMSFDTESSPGPVAICADNIPHSTSSLKQMIRPLNFTFFYTGALFNRGTDLAGQLGRLYAIELLHTLNHSFNQSVRT